MLIMHDIVIMKNCEIHKGFINCWCNVFKEDYDVTGNSGNQGATDGF